MIPDDWAVPNVANHGTMKSHNISTFMQVLRLHAPVSRADLSRLTGLDKKCVSLFSNELIDGGFIQETGVAAGQRGRPGYLLDFVPGRNYSIGLAVQADRVNCALFELPDRLVEAAVHPISADATRDEVVATVTRAARELTGRGRKIAGVGISFPGTMDLRKGVIYSAANLACLNNFHFRDPFRNLDPGPVRFEQSSRAAALAESWFGLGKTAGNFAKLEMNVGISVVMVNRSGLYHGPDGFVGELGHVIVQRNGLRCRCGNHGCLEAYLGESAIKNRLRDAGVDPDALFTPNGRDSEPMRWKGPAALDEWQKQPPPPPAGAVRILRDAGVWLGRGLGPIINLFNPDSVIIQGELMRYADLVLPGARKELAKCCLAEKLQLTGVMPSRLRFADAMGAAALAFPGWFEGGFNECRESRLPSAAQ